MAVIVKGVHVHFQLPKLLLDGYPELLLLVDDKQAQITETYILADDPVGADQDIHLALFQLFQGSLDLCGRTGPADIIDLAGEILQALTKRLVMLESQYGGGVPTRPPAYCPIPP